MWVMLHQHPLLTPVVKHISHKQTTLDDEVAHKNEVRSQNSVFPTLSATVLNDVSVGLIPLEPVGTSSAHSTDSVSSRR